MPLFGASLCLCIVISVPRFLSFLTRVHTIEACSPLILEYGESRFMVPETIVWLIHDCTATSYNIVWIRRYIEAMKVKGAQFLWVIMSKQDLPPPNKRTDIVSEHRQMLETVLKEQAAGIMWLIHDTPGFNLKTGNFVKLFVKDVKGTLPLMASDGELNTLHYRETSKVVR